MKAMLSKGIGGPDTLVLEELPDPVPAAGEVVIAVKACGVNYPDLLIIEDRYQYKPPRPFSPGGEVAGIVEAVGSGVSGLKVGDRVIGSSMWGGMAEKLALKAERCIPVPDSMPMDEAAALILTYGTSIYALKDRARLQKGETLLVLGAAGGVGLSAVELGKAMGARVIAAASSAEKVALARKHGASDGVVYPAGPFDKAGSKALADLFKQACGERGANVIYDPVGGDYSEAALRAIAWEGRFLVVGFPAGIARLPLNLTLLKSCQVVGVFWGEFTRRDPAGNAANIRALMQYYADGAIRPLVSERYPLAQAGAAIAKLGARQAMGKIVVTME
jgi:NADPH:quinone reductase